jgi:uroporphyrinogen-III decarboxylase
LVGPTIYREFVWSYQLRLVNALKDLGVRVRLHVCGNTRPILAEIAKLGCDIVDIDSAVSMSEARRLTGAGQILLGGVDPVRIVQTGPRESIRQALEHCHRQAGPGYVVACGCEVPPDTPPAHVRVFAEYAARAEGSTGKQ